MDLTTFLTPTSRLHPLLHLLPPPLPRRRRLTPPSAFLPTSSSPSPSSASNPIDSALDVIPPPARLAGSAVLVSVAVAVGFVVGVRAGGGRKVVGVGGAVAAGVVGGVVVGVVNGRVPEVAAGGLRRLVDGFDDPAALRREDVEGVAAKYGVSTQDEAFKAELCNIYSRYVYSVLPPVGENLKGDEVDKIIQFKNSLGIDDPDAASVHMEIGRRIFRERLETGDRDADMEQRRAFQKLVYVSALVFGEASKFLLPWKRIFKVTDAQVEIAIRDNAQRLYAVKLNDLGRDIDEKQLITLRQAQIMYKLSDEIAAEMFRVQSRKLVEENITTALEVLKSRTKASRGLGKVIEELEKVLFFNNLLISLSKHPEAAAFAVGVGPISLIGGEYDGDRKTDDLKLLYMAYAAESFPGGRIDKNKVSALNQLKNIFGLGNREAENIMLDVSTKVYRRRLSQAVSSGDLEAAPSKAAFLQNLCEEIQFNPEIASDIHKEIYRQKLQQCVAKGELSEGDVSTLLRLRVMLCITQETVDAAHADICGTLFERVVKDAIASGVEGYDANVRASVRKASQGLRLTKEAALAIASKAVRKVFMNFIQRSRGAGNRIEAARELKKMIAFNTLVVTELLADIKGESANMTESVKEDVKEEQKDVKEEQKDVEEDEWDSLQTLRKTRPNEELEAKLGKPGQTEITLRDDLQERDRGDLYRTYLLFCLSGESTVVPFGVQITTKKDNSEFLLLNQLGGILGLSGKEIVDIHRNLAEQAFMKQAEVILADGQLTKARVEQLNEVQKQVGLPGEYAQKIIKHITTTKMSAAIETAVNQGRISIKQVRELKEASIDLDSMISERLRVNLFRKTVDEIFTSGTGEFDEEEVYEKIPADLSIDPKTAKQVVQELATNRLSNSLVQAVSLLRQKNREGAVSSLNDILACDKAVPAEPFTWSNPEELHDLYSLYLKSIPSAEKLSRLQYLLRITDVTAASLRDSAERGALLPLENDEEEIIF